MLLFRGGLGAQGGRGLRLTIVGAESAGGEQRLTTVGAVGGVSARIGGSFRGEKRATVAGRGESLRGGEGPGRENVEVEVDTSADGAENPPGGILEILPQGTPKAGKSSLGEEIIGRASEKGLAVEEAAEAGVGSPDGMNALTGVAKVPERTLKGLTRA